MCLYRDENGRKCAAGCLISDAEYKKEFEGMAWDIFVKNNKVTKTHQSLICDMQDIHDDQPVKDWPDELAKLALKRYLKTTAITAQLNSPIGFITQIEQEYDCQTDD
jgi:hypothetical protein